MPKPRKPLAMQKGNLTVDQQLKKEAEENIVTTGKEQLSNAPPWLINKIAQTEFKRLVAEFEKIEVIGNLDINNLGGYCNAFAFYIDATEQLKGQPLIVDKKMPNGATQKAENPLIKIQNHYANELRKFASLCGLTIDSRLKFATTKVNKADDKIEDEFGDI